MSNGAEGTLWCEPGSGLRTITFRSRVTESVPDRGLEAADRQLAWLMSLAGVVLIATYTSGAVADWYAFATWWNLGGVVVLLIIAGLAVAGRVLPMRVLRAGWRAAPILGVILLATGFLAYRGPAETVVPPWLWTVEAVLVSYPVLWLRALPSVLFALGSASLPALSGWLFLGSVPQSVVIGTPTHFSNVGLVALLLGVRGQLIRLRRVEALAERQELDQARAAAQAHHRGVLARLVHDELLSVFTAAMALSGPAPPAMRTEARDAVALLERGASVASDDGQQTTREALAGLVELVRGIAPECTVDARPMPGTVPTAVLEGIGGAAAEALRNSMRHAGPAASREVTVRVGPDAVRLMIRDDGPGFDPESVDLARMGIRDSVLGRMRALPGGRAELRTAPGTGTEVVLEWTR